MSYTLRPYQNFAINGGDPRRGPGIMRCFARHKRVLLVMATGCHRKGERVLLANGRSLAVEDVRVGDRLAGPMHPDVGNARTVLALHRGEGDMYEVRPVKGEPFYVTGDHVLTLYPTPTGRPGFKPGLVDVRVRDYLGWTQSRKDNHKLLRCAVEHFESPITAHKIPPYILGVIIGDGHLAKGVVVSKPDPEIHAALAEYAASLGLRCRVVASEGRCPAIHIVGRPKVPNPVMEDLRQLSLAVSSGERFIPDVYKLGSLEYRRQVLAGLLDTDGHLTADGCSYDYISQSERLARDVVFVARSLGLAAYLRPCEKHCQTGAGGTYYRVSISGNTDRIPCRIPRKQAAPRAQKKNPLVTGFTVSKVADSEPFYGFTVDGDNRYLLADFTITHNCGKTQTFLALAQRYVQKTGGRVLVLAHRDELVSQPIERGANMGLHIAREQGSSTGVGYQVVASTIQTMQYRREKYPPDYFGLVIADEAHHSPSDMFRETLDYFGGAYTLGVTATPDRLDGVGLGEVFSAVGYDYGMADAVDDGWLVPVRPEVVEVDGLDLSKLRVRGGDFAPEELGEMMAEHSHYVASVLVQRAGPRPTIVFCCSVAHAMAQAEALRKYTDAGVAFVSGETPKDERAQILTDFAAGRIQFVTNVEVLTEGTDLPKTACIAMARPTKSRGLLVQAIGRGCRTWPGLLDTPELREGSPEARRAAISASPKPDCMVLDFTGACEKHSLANVADALAGKLTPEERAALVAIPLCGESTVSELVEEARRIAAEAAKARAAEAAAYSTYKIDPFHPTAVLGLKDGDDPRAPRCSAEVADWLGKRGIKNAENLSEQAAAKIKKTICVRTGKGLCTYKQMTALQKAGVPVASTVRMSMETAAKLMDELQANRWRRPERWDGLAWLGGDAAAEPKVAGVSRR